MRYQTECLSVTDCTFLQPTSWCTIRPQKEGYVFYNACTDELHLISDSGYSLYQWCDGLHSIGEIIQKCIRDNATLQPSADRKLQAFFEQLLARNILEISHDVRP